MRDILQPVMCGPKMGITKDRKLGVMSKKCLHSKMVQNYGNRSAGFCLVMQAVGQVGHSLYAIPAISLLLVHSGAVPCSC